MFFQPAFADGSKELNQNGGYRAYLYSGTDANTSFPFPTNGTMKVYVKAGETIYLGSSAQGIASGTINLRSPDGATYTSGASATIGLIANRAQEIAGPSPNSGGYTPFMQTVKAGQQGVWEVDFVSPSNGVDEGGSPTAILAAASWAQPGNQYIAAFDVSVRDSANTKFIPGRVFTNVFSGILGNFIAGFNGVFNVLTKDGYQYTLNNNGQAGNGFTFFVNNKGFRGSDGAASYQSINDLSSFDVQDPRSADTQSGVTQKIFFNPPAADLPSSANTPGGSTTWLLNSPSEASVGTVTFVGEEGTVGKAGTSPLGGNFVFSSTGGGNYTIVIDANRNGVYTDGVDRKLTGPISTGANAVYWDGLDGQGNKVTADTVGTFAANVSITSTAGEVHFPFFDVERNINGILLTRVNGNSSPDNVVYWDDSPITIIGTPSVPIANSTGINSVVNGHKWGTATTDPNNDADFGNNKGIDTWAYIPSAPVVSKVGFKLYEADLQIDSILSNTGCTGQQVNYAVTVKNNGPDDVSGAKFIFSFPKDISNISVKNVTTAGSLTVSNGVLTDSTYNANLAMTNGSIVTFLITGTVAKLSQGNLITTASILRPADITDPDATDPDAAPPTDPNTECNATSGITTCNNILTRQTLFAISPNAGDDQTVFQFATATITATNGVGTWSQANGDPSIAVIGYPASSVTTVTGLIYPGVYHFINSNASGCADTLAITVVSTDLIIPNIFTPNNDGKNDVFYIKGLESYPGSQLLIFNRWGNEVYRADNYQDNWDGSNLAEGTYYYILNRKDHLGAVVPFKGWVFLKRSKQ